MNRFWLILLFLHFVQSKLSDDFRKLENYILEGLTKNGDVCKPYEFMCEKFISSSDPNARAFSNLNENFLDNKTLPNIEEAIHSVEITDKNVPNYKKWLRIFHDQCQNYSNSSNKDDLTQDIFTIDHIFGPFAIFNNDNFSKVSIWGMFGRFTVELGVALFIQVKTVKSLSVDNQSVTIFDISNVGLVPEPMNETVMYNVMIKSLKILNYTIDKNVVKHLSSAVVKFHEDWHNITRTYNGGSLFPTMANLNDKILTVDDLSELFPKFPLRDFFSGILSFDDIELLLNKTNRTSFIIRDQTSFALLINFINDQQPIIFRNYIYWSSLYWSQKYGTNYKNTCRSLMGTDFLPAVVRTLFDYNKWNLSEWVMDLKETFSSLSRTLRKQAKNLKWMSESVRVAYHEYLDTFNAKYPIRKWFLNDDIMQQRTPIFDASLYFIENLVQKFQWEARSRLQRILSNDPIDTKDDLLRDDSRDFYFPISKLIPPYYHPKYPLSVKYALVGVSFVEKIFQQMQIKKPVISEECIKHSIRRPRQASSDDACKFCCNNFAEFYGLSISYQLFKSQAANITYDPSKMPMLKSFNEDQIFLMTAGRRMCDTYQMNKYLDKAVFDYTVKVFRGKNNIFADRNCTELKCIDDSCNV